MFGHGYSSDNYIFFIKDLICVTCFVSDVGINECCVFRIILWKLKFEPQQHAIYSFTFKYCHQEGDKIIFYLSSRFFLIRRLS